VMLQLLLLISRSLSLQFQLVNLRSKRSRFECFWLYRAAVSSNRLSRSGLRRPYFQPASAFFRLRRPRRFVDNDNHFYNRPPSARVTDYCGVGKIVGMLLGHYKDPSEVPTPIQSCETTKHLSTRVAARGALLRSQRSE
jgi:hypothetical protein